MERTRIVISSKARLFDFKIGELIKYRDLVFLLFLRNYSTRYKQTVLGPAWLVITPLLTVCMQTLIFGKLAGLSTDGIPLPLFYLSGNIIWLYFSNIVSQIATTFTANAFLFGKVYFPRLAAPLSQILTCTADFLIRFILFAIFLAFFGLKFGINYFSWKIALIPLFLLQLALLGMGVGLLISAVTVKYKDLQVLVSVALQFWMYATPVIYSTELIPEKFSFLLKLNPASASVVLFKNIFFGIDASWYSNLAYAFLISLFVLFLGLIAFNKSERNFLDTI
ncbi:MAG: ABC transporter permease [Treponema sp.]|uniref:ABC transporter permease n=1 Tax=Treponema sp. TaxID=166 RepID=UPI0025DAA9E2|nr:ABC transporter permease [Treponema sp.]MBQ8678846.1 ABC transporter permease [Treponema sp.]